MTLVIDHDRVHPAQPKSTARRGVRRLHEKVRARIPTALTRETALSSLSDRHLRQSLAVTGSLVWLLGNSTLVQPCHQAQVPGDGLSLRPVRRIGTYKGARNRIGMFVVHREGVRVHLCAESRLEMAWMRDLDRDPRTSWMHAQPFAMVWQVKDRCIWRVPDLVIIRDGAVVVVDVKPEGRVVDDPYFALVTELTAMTIQAAGWSYEVCGSLSDLRINNLKQVARHRWPNPQLAARVCSAAEVRSKSLGGVVQAAGADDNGLVTALHLIGSGTIGIDLNLPISLASPVQWHDALAPGNGSRDLLAAAAPWMTTTARATDVRAFTKQRLELGRAPDPMSLCRS
jgi:hypothetical protein